MITFAYLTRVPCELLIVKVKAFQRLITLAVQYHQLLVQLVEHVFDHHMVLHSNPSSGIAPIRVARFYAESHACTLYVYDARDIFLLEPYRCKAVK